MEKNLKSIYHFMFFKGFFVPPSLYFIFFLNLVKFTYPSLTHHFDLLRGQESAGIVTCDGADPPTYTAHKVKITPVEEQKSAHTSLQHPLLSLYLILQSVSVARLVLIFILAFPLGNGISERRLPFRGSPEAAPRGPRYKSHALLHHGGVGAAELPALRGGHHARQGGRGA